MGLLDNLENQALGSVAGGSSSLLATGLLQMIQNQPGGLQGLVQSFHDKGMGGLVSSWISSGPNPPISGDQVHQVLGSDQVKALAARLIWGAIWQKERRLVKALQYVEHWAVLVLT